MRLLRWPLRMLLILLVLYLYFAFVHPRQALDDHRFFDSAGPWAIAHRGGRGLWPENTLQAFEQSSALGVDMIEMDLRLTSDGVIVVIHDETVDRTTNGRGPVDQLTLDLLQKLDAGHRFEDAAGNFPYRGRGLVVPTLKQVLARFGAMRLNLEMKGFTPSSAVELCRLLQRNSAADRVLVASFGHAEMSAFRAACPSVATSATFREGATLYQLSRLHLASLYRSPAHALQTPESFGQRTVLDPRFLDLTDSLNLPVQVWTVNDPAAMKRILSMGVQGIVTDYPDRLLQLMGRLNRKTP